MLKKTLKPHLVFSTSYANDIEPLLPFNYLWYYLLQHILFSINTRQGPEGRNISGSLLHWFTLILSTTRAEDLPRKYRPWRKAEAVTTEFKTGEEMLNTWKWTSLSIQTTVQKQGCLIRPCVLQTSRVFSLLKGTLAFFSSSSSFIFPEAPHCTSLTSLIGNTAITVQRGRDKQPFQTLELHILRLFSAGVIVQWLPLVFSLLYVIV